MALKLKKWDTAEQLKTGDDIARSWDACLEEGGDDAEFITADPPSARRPVHEH